MLVGNEMVSLAMQWTEGGSFSEAPKAGVFNSCLNVSKGPLTISRGMQRYAESYRNGVQHFINVLTGTDEEDEMRGTGS